MELGVFLAVASLGALGFWRNRSLMFTGLAVGVFFALAFLLTLGTDVIMTKTLSAFTTVETQYNATGGLVSNSTIVTPARSEETSVINDMQVPLAWVLFALAIFMTFLFFRNVIGLAGWT